MNNWIEIIKKLQTAALNQPLLASIFITDFAILLFHRPPFFFSLLMMGGLVAMSMYFGQKLALFNLVAKSEAKPAASTPSAKAETKAVAEVAPNKVETKVAPKSTSAEAKPKKAAKAAKAKT